MVHVTPFTGRQKAGGRPHFLSLRNVAHSANDGTAVSFFRSWAMTTPNHFDQGEFDFNASGSEEGYRKWRQDLETKQRAFEARWGIILSRRVSVMLKDHAKPLCGILEWIATPKQRSTSLPLFRLKGLEFTPADIESIVQVDPG